MKDITVKKADLLKKLYANRRAHQELYDKACDVYRTEVAEELQKMLSDCRNSPINAIQTHVSLERPVSYLPVYDRAIGMLEMNIKSTVELDETSFNQYVLDNWSWKLHVSTLNSSYASKWVK